MKERSILFNAEMVRAVLDGRKTQTRRVIKPQPQRDENGGLFWKGDEPLWPEDCPYGQLGDRLLIKERHLLNGHWQRNGVTKAGRPAWRFVCDKSKGVMFYDDPPIEICTRKDQVGWFRRGPRFMPRWAVRTKCNLTGVRVEMVQEITPEDCEAEGITGGTHASPCNGLPYENYYTNGLTYAEPRGAFRDLWNSINAKRGYSWAENPWVWVVEFELAEK